MKYKGKLLLIGLSVMLFQSCVRDKDRSNKDGDLELFELRADQRHYSDDFREGIRHKFDDSEHDAPGDIGDWHDYVDRDYRANQINRRVTDEPAISYAELNRVSSCPIPRLNTSSPVLASGIQWEVFFYCQTGLSATGEFPDMPSLKSRHAAFRFARAVLAKFASRNWHLIRNMTLEDKVKIFEGYFIGTKLRPMTNAEKVRATRLVHRTGLVVATAAYLYNWYDSEFYHKYFDYSEARSPRYNSTRILGTVYDAGGLPKAGANYALDSTTLAGFKTSGVSAPAFEIIRRKRVDYNYSIQVYVPISDDKYTGTKRNPDLALSARFERLSANALIKANGDELVKNVALRLSATPANIATWPDVDRITNSHLAGLSYALGNGTATCAAPSVQNNLVDGYQWQDFIACVFGARVRDVVPGLNSDYLPLITTRSAVEMLGVYVMGYLRSDAGINDKPEIIAAKILTVVTLQQPAGAALDKIKASISSLGLDLTLASLVQNWYLSATYARFNFAGANVIPRDRYNISGIVKDQAGTVLPGVTVSVLDFRGQEVANGLSDANGRFTVIYRYLAVSAEARFKSFSVKATKAGYSAGTAVLAADGTTDKLVSLNLLQDGVSIPGQSGKVISADSKVTIEIPAGAVTELNSFQISGVAQTLAQDFNNAKIMVFNAGPSYQFLKHVKVSFKLDQDFVNQAPPLTRWVLLTQNSQGKWEKLRNNYYDAATGTVSGLTHHFSIFIAIDFASIFCYFDSASVQNLCYPTDPLVLSRSALADVADRNKGVYFPEGIPSLLTQGRNLLVAGGWDTSAIDNVASNQQVIDGMQSMNLPATCLTSSCPTIPFPATVSANGQTYNLSGGSRFLIDIEAQRCAQNPTASIPQPQLNGVRATDINVDATTNTVDNLSHTAYYSYTACVGSGWRRFCYPQYGSYTEYHSVPITHGARIRNYNHAYDRNFGVSPIVWNDGATLHTTDASPIYSPGPVPGDSNSALWTNSLHNFVVDNMNTYWGQNVAPAETTYVANTYLPQYVTNQLNSLALADPVWNSDNCFPAAPPPSNQQAFYALDPANPSVGPGRLGYGVAASGNVAYVNASGAGIAVYVMSPTGQWRYDQLILPPAGMFFPDGAPRSWLAANSNMVAVRAIGGGAHVLVYRRGIAGSFTQIADLMDAANPTGTAFGGAVGISETELIISAAQAGYYAVYEISGDHNSLLLRQTIIVGAGSFFTRQSCIYPEADDQMAVGQGFFVVAGRSGGGLGCLTVVSKSGGTINYDTAMEPIYPISAGYLSFSSLAIKGQTIIAGSGQTFVPGLTNIGNAGRIMILDPYYPGYWQQVAEILNPTPAFLDNFGYSVGISGNKLLSGAPFKYYSSGFASPNFQRGELYVYDFSNQLSASLQATIRHTLSGDGVDGVAYDNFCYSMAVASGFAICTAPNLAYKINANDRLGAVFFVPVP